MSSISGFESLEYPLPPNIEDLICYGAFDHLDKTLTRPKYKERLHLLLHAEEYQRRKEIQKYVRPSFIFYILSFLFILL